MARSVYVLGAGASKAACGLPVVSEILTKAILSAHARSLAWVNDLRVVLERIGLPELLEDAPGPRILCLQGKKYHIEKLLRMFKEEGNTRAEHALKNVIFGVLADKEPLANDNLYTEFVHGLTPSTKNPIGLISFNYDLCLDLAWARLAQASQTPWCYGVDFEGGISPRFPSYERLSHNDPALWLLKLHGSINFMQCSRCSALRLEFVQSFPPQAGSMICENCNTIGCFETFLVAPEPDKPKPTRSRNAWDRGEQLLHDCEHLTIVGYSFGELDEHVVQLFRTALNGGTRDRLTLVDRSEETRERVAELLGSSFSNQCHFSEVQRFVKDLSLGC